MRGARREVLLREVRRHGVAAQEGAAHCHEQQQGGREGDAHHHRAAVPATGDLGRVEDGGFVQVLVQ